MSTLTDTARAFAAAGIRVFPCKPLSKEPACAGGFHAASCDPTQIEAWISENENYNWALCPEHAGWFVIDEEVGADLACLDELPETYSVRTPRGGRHRYFEGSAARSVQKLGPKIDTRGIGGYVLIPPSRVVDVAKGIDGVYEELDDKEIASLPTWVPARLAPKAKATVAADVPLDLPTSITTARTLLRDYVKRGKVAIQKSGGDGLTYQIACEVLNIGLTPETATELMLTEWYPHCQPNDKPGFIARKVENASNYSQNEAGAWAVKPAAEVFADVVAPAELKQHRKFYLEDETEQEQGTDATWVIENVIPEHSTILMIGPSGAYKSFLTLDMLLSTSTGTVMCGVKPRTGVTVYSALEGLNATKKARRRAWKIGHDITHVSDFYTVRAPMIGMPGDVEEFCIALDERLAERQPRLIAFDTLQKMMAGLDENSVADAGRLLAFCDGMVERYQCSVIVLHHTGKDAGRGARGSSAFYAGFDTVLEVMSNRAHKTAELWVRKHKDAEEREFPYLFQGQSVASSLVFYPLDPKDYEAATEAGDPFARSITGRVLRELLALGRENAVTTHVLASTLMPRSVEASEEEWQASVATAEHTLRRLSRSKLAAYCEGTGRSLIWFMPVQ